MPASAAAGGPHIGGRTIKAFLTITAVVAALAVAAPGAFGAGRPQGFITDTLGGNGHAKQQVRGYRFITDTLAPGGGPPVEATTSASSFNWPDAGVGAGSAVGAVLVLVGGSLVVARRQGRLAI